MRNQQPTLVSKSRDAPNADSLARASEFNPLCRNHGSIEVTEHDAKQTPAPETVTTIDPPPPKDNDSLPTKNKSRTFANQRVGIWSVTDQNRNDSPEIVVQNFSSAS